MNVKPTTRRDLLVATLAGMGLRQAGAAGLPPVPLPRLPAGVPALPATMPQMPDPPIPAGAPGLGMIAAGHGRAFGAAVQSQRFAGRCHPMAPLTALECGLLMPDYETKMAFMQPKEGVFDFSAIDRLLAWARAHGKPVRGHGLVWHQGLPEWAAIAITRGPGAGPRRARQPYRPGAGPHPGLDP